MHRVFVERGACLLLIRGRVSEKACENGHQIGLRRPARALEREKVTRLALGHGTRTKTTFPRGADGTHGGR